MDAPGVDTNTANAEAHEGAREASPASAKAASGNKAPSNTGNHTSPTEMKKRKRRKIIAGVLAVIIVLVAGCAGSAAVSAKAMLDQVEVISAQARSLGGQLKAGDRTGAADSSEAIAQAATRIRDELDAPIWSLASCVPEYGEDVGRIRILGDIAQDMTSNALGSMVEELSKKKLGDLTLADGSFNLKALERILSSLETASPAIARATDKLATIGEPKIDRLKEPLSTLKSLVGLLDKMARVSPQLSETIPAFLGKDEKRTYLVLAQTNAELRSTGGLSGSYGKLTIDKGKIDIGEFVGAGAIAPYLGKLTVNSKKLKPYLVPITDTEAELFSRRVSYDPRDCNFVPDFARSSELEAAISHNTGFADVDGVIAIDPFVFQDLLGVVGGITTTNGTYLDSSNAAAMLLHDAYFELPTSKQDAFFADAAKQAFAKLKSGTGGFNMMALARTIVNSVEGRHLQIWSSDKAEEAALHALDLDGSLTDDAEHPEAAIYLNYIAGCKLAWYLNANTEVSEVRENADGSKTYNITLELKNEIDTDTAQNGPKYVTGKSVVRQRQSGEMAMRIYLFAPAGGTITDMHASADFPLPSDWPPNPDLINPNEGGMAHAAYEGLELWHGIFQIPPEGSATFSYTVTTAPETQTDLQLRMTPTIQNELKARE